MNEMSPPQPSRTKENWAAGDLLLRDLSAVTDVCRVEKRTSHSRLCDTGAR